MTDTKIIIDLSKPEGQRETIIALTQEEIKQREIDQIAFETQETQRLALEAAKAEAQASAVAKLEALGLTADEIAALKS